MLKYAKSLKFEEEPNYGLFKEYLKEMIKAAKLDHDSDTRFDWECHAAALEKRSTLYHLSLHQMGVRNSPSPGRVQDESAAAAKDGGELRYLPHNNALKKGGHGRQEERDAAGSYTKERAELHGSLHVHLLPARRQSHEARLDADAWGTFEAEQRDSRAHAADSPGCRHKEEAMLLLYLLSTPFNRGCGALLFVSC